MKSMPRHIQIIPYFIPLVLAVYLSLQIRYSADRLLPLLVFIFAVVTILYLYKSIGSRKYALYSWENFRYQIYLPEYISKADRIRIYFYNSSKHPVYIDNLTIEFTQKTI
ncbi:hypothetical protein MNBD_BACTEROID01-312 [hydrothermal vent metagenome]|uniref:Uncharacterized protein n=1 Tax=hydrothermal vent metagenome TaxID=652676 RepID=A0A3B0TTX7_9ZZZZ